MVLKHKCPGCQNDVIMRRIHGNYTADKAKIKFWECPDCGEIVKDLP